MTVAAAVSHVAGAALSGAGHTFRGLRGGMKVIGFGCSLVWSHFSGCRLGRIQAAGSSTASRAVGPMAVELPVHQGDPRQSNNRQSLAQYATGGGERVHVLTALGDEECGTNALVFDLTLQQDATAAAVDAQRPDRPGTVSVTPRPSGSAASGRPPSAW